MYNSGNSFGLISLLTSGSGGVGANSLVVDADGEETAFKYFPSGTSPITDVDVCVDQTGSLSGINFRIRIESDSADAPSGTILGATNNAITPEFTVSADGFTGLKTLAENTGNLTINVPVWIILYRSSGSSLSGSNYIAFRGLDQNRFGVTGVRSRLYTSSSWTGTTPINRYINYVVKHADNSYDGYPISAALANPASATDINSTYKHGIRFKCGAQIKVVGIAWYCIKTGSPNALVVSVYSGDSLSYSQTVPAATLVTAIYLPIWFTSPVLLAADTNIYIILSQESDGGDDSNDYDDRVMTIVSSTYRAAALPTDFAFVYGTSSTPSSLSVSDTDVPLIVPLIADPATDLDQAASGGGGLPILGGSIVRG